MNNLSALYDSLKKKHGYSNGDELILIVIGLLRNNQRSRILIDLALSNDHRWSLRIPLMRKLLAFLIFPIQIFNWTKNEKLQILEPISLGQFAIFSQRAAIGTSFDVRWSLVAQAVCWKRAVSFKNVNLPESLLKVIVWLLVPHSK